MPSSPPSFAHTEPAAVAAALAAGESLVLLDVRETWEWQQSHLPRAKHLPLGSLPASLGDLELAPTERIVTYCHHGVRSQRAAALLLAQGYVNVASMDGGIDAWASQVDPSVGRY